MSEDQRLLNEILDALTRIEALLQEQNTAMTEPDDDDESERWRKE